MVSLQQSIQSLKNLCKLRLTAAPPSGGRWFAFAVLVCMRRPGLHAPPWSACAALVWHITEIQQPSNSEKTSRHMANIRSIIAVAGRSGSATPSYQMNFCKVQTRSTTASAAAKIRSLCSGFYPYLWALKSWFRAVWPPKSDRTPEAPHGSMRLFIDLAKI